MKRKRAPKPAYEEEFFEDKRNLEDLWKDTFPVGTEWDQFDSVYKYNWNFFNLENAFEEEGKLFGENVYLFGCTEPQLVPYKGEEKVVVVPVVVAVVSPFPPSDKIGITSVQREAEEIVPMKRMKMDWVPYIPLEKRGSQVERVKKTLIHILTCTQRRSALKHLKIERMKKFEYCLPYFYQPFREGELEKKTEVEISYQCHHKIICEEFDWEMDDLEELTDNLIEEEELTSDHEVAFKNFVEEEVQKAKQAIRQAKESRERDIAEMSEEAKSAFQNMKFYKFYPMQTPDSPDISTVKAKFINRYYGKAHEIL